MKWVFKVLQGQHKGAELALPEGSSFTAGRASSCDLVLMDATLAAEAFELHCSNTEIRLTARMEGIRIDGVPVPQSETKSVPLYTVVAVGMTRFCLGEAGKAWPASPDRLLDELERTAIRHRIGRQWRQALLVGITLVGLGGALLGLYRWAARDAIAAPIQTLPPPETMTAETIAERFGLTLEQQGERICLNGNVADSATREHIRTLVRQHHPSAQVNVTDDATLRRSIEQLFTALDEPHARVVAATNRCVSVGGSLSSQAALNRLFTAIRNDLPYVRHLEAAADLQIDTCVSAVSPEKSSPAVPTSAPVTKRNPVTLPVAGIVQAPYPCLILKDGQRCSEGGQIGRYTILRITPDCVEVQQGEHTYQWIP